MMMMTRTTICNDSPGPWKVGAIGVLCWAGNEGQLNTLCCIKVHPDRKHIGLCIRCLFPITASIQHHN